MQSIDPVMPAVDVSSEAQAAPVVASPTASPTCINIMSVWFASLGATNRGKKSIRVAPKEIEDDEESRPPQPV